MSTARTRTSRKEEQRKAHTFEDAKAEVDRKCNLYPGYRAVVEDVRSVLRLVENRRPMSAFDMDHSVRPPSGKYRDERD